jgi:hypothetical protein
MLVPMYILLPYPPEGVGRNARYRTVGLDEVDCASEEEGHGEAPAPRAADLVGVEGPDDAVGIEVEEGAVVVEVLEGLANINRSARELTLSLLAAVRFTCVV